MTVQYFFHEITFPMASPLPSSEKLDQAIDDIFEDIIKNPHFDEFAVGTNSKDIDIAVESTLQDIAQVEYIVRQYIEATGIILAKP